MTEPPLNPSLMTCPSCWEADLSFVQVVKHKVGMQLTAISCRLILGSRTFDLSCACSVQVAEPLEPWGCAGVSDIGGCMATDSLRLRGLRR